MSHLKPERITAPLSVCVCGHTGDGPDSSHAGFHGHGPCADGVCGCTKFTWNGWTTFGAALAAEMAKKRKR